MSTEDRELLELAAKAAGVPGVFVDYTITGTNIRCWGMGSNPSTVFQSISPIGLWNPLTDDGDALRLAVKLAIEISPCTVSDSVVCEPKGSPDSIITVEALDDYGVRRAIVRAAAEIGRAMP